MTNSEKKLPKTSIEIEEAPLSETQLLSEIHWLTFSMALKSFDQKAARARRKEDAKVRSQTSLLAPSSLQRRVAR